jgi:YidC/Oxa1 family membrane protein insertase
VGLLNPLYNAVSWVLLRFHDLWSLIFNPDGGAAWGLSIVGLVVVIRIMLIPLFVKQIKSQRAMQALQPKMMDIRKRYANDRQRQSEEMMKLYRENGTNPLSSCLPIIVQAPFFFSLYHVLSYVSREKTVGVMNAEDVASFHQAKIFGAPIYETFVSADSTEVRIVATVMIIAMSLSQFVTTRQLMLKNMPAGVENPMASQQKILMYVFPVMFAVFGVNFPIGVLIYWLTTNLWTMGQQFYVIRRNPTPGSPAYDELQRRRASHAKAQAVAAGEAVEGTPDDSAETPVRRQQPKRQPRSKRAGKPQQQPKTPPPGAPPAEGPAQEEEEQ